MTSRVILHKGPIPGTSHGHHWFNAADGHQYGITSGPGPDRGNEGWPYLIIDVDGQQVPDEETLYSLAEVRAWAAAQRPRPALTAYELDTLWSLVIATLGLGERTGDDAAANPAEMFAHGDLTDRVAALKRIHHKFSERESPA